MLDRTGTMVRRVALGVWLPVILLFPQVAGAAQPAGRGSASSERSVGEVKLLTDGDYVSALLDGIDRAQSEIFLSAYLFRTVARGKGHPEAVLNRLLAAAGRGVRIEAVLEQNQESDELSRSNAVTAARLRQGGVRVCLEAPDRITHTKLVVIDRRYVLIGSHNLTQSALGHNHEASVWIDSAPLAQEALNYLKSLCPGQGR